MEFMMDKSGEKHDPSGIANVQTHQLSGSIKQASSSVQRQGPAKNTPITARTVFPYPEKVAGW